MKLDQSRMPIYEALQQMKRDRLVPFDVPGHKHGKGNPELTNFLGEKCMSVDVNSMKPLDNLCHPVSVIKEAEQLAADAFNAAHAFFMVGGTTSSVQSMIMASVKAGEKIIMPRNVHRSAINAMILTGAIPIYVNPEVDKRLGISLGMSIDQVKQAIIDNPDAKAILINNPTYYGICSNLKEIVRLAHEHNMLALVDEAHGTHFYFSDDLPMSAMEAGADMASVSMHKSGGSLTQSSFLLLGPNVNADYVRQVINLTQTTSGSYLLMVSLDMSRKNLALNGKEIFSKVKRLAHYAREEINRIGDYYAYCRELINGDSVYDFDVTKLSIFTLDVGLAGIEVYDLLRDEYGIQIEFGDIGNVLAYISVGDSEANIERLVGALSEIRRRFKKDRSGMLDHEYINPEVVISPQAAFYGEKESLPLMQSVDRVCSEFVMCYPPGIPILAPGEKITKEIKFMNENHLADVLIIGRGGGSLEDLWPFNEEIVARAIYDSEIPIISAVGHETDFSISDFVADLRAPTPSAAAELAVANISDVKYTLEQYNNRYKNALKKKIEVMRLLYEKCMARPAFKNPTQKINEKLIVVDMKVKSLQTSINLKLKEERTKFVKEVARLDSLSPLKTLSRGYSIVTTQNGNIAKSVEDLKKDDEVKIRLIDGEKQAKIK